MWEGEGLAMQRGQSVEVKEHKQLLACSLRTRWKHAHLQVFFMLLERQLCSCFCRGSLQAHHTVRV